MPRETRKEDTRTVNKGGVRFVARMMVPPGDVRYTFSSVGSLTTIQRTVHALDIKFMIKKKRPIGNPLPGLEWRQSTPHARAAM